MLKIDVLEVKRCFVVAQLIRKQKFGISLFGIFSFVSNRFFMKNVSLADFENRLKMAKHKVFTMSENKLDKLIRKEYKKRLLAINSSDWYLMEMSPDEVGVWRGGGGLPREWTEGSLRETAQKVKQAIDTNAKDFSGRAKYSIKNILKTNVKRLQEEKYLFPIMFQGSTGTRGRKGLKKQMKYDIDDGCMRSIALVISGTEKIKAYVGFPKK